MGMSKRVDQMTKGPLRQFRCNNEKCWLKVGVTTLTLMSSLTLSMMVANAQTATANVAQTTQTSEKDTPGTVTAQIQSSESVVSASVPTMNATSKNSADSSYSDVSDPKNDSVASEPTNSSSTADTSKTVISGQEKNSQASAGTTASVASVNSTPTNKDDQSAIYNDAALQAKNIDVGKLTDNNVLKLAALFHIFANQASLSSDTRGNLAVGTLNKANDFGTRDQTTTNLTDEDIDYIQQILDGQQIPTNAFSDPKGNRVVFGKDFTITTDSSGRTEENNQRIDSSAVDQVDKDTDGKVYIDFAKVFSELIENSNKFSSETQSAGVDEELKDENNRSVNVANATSSNGIIYVNLPFEYLSNQRQITIKGVSSSNDGPTIVINLTDIPAGGTQTVSSQVHLQYDKNTDNVQDNDLLSKPNHVLWNFGTGSSDTSNATININNSFYGSILAPNATINVTASSFYGNIAANVVNITGGTSHKWDIRSMASSTSQASSKAEVGPAVYTNNLGQLDGGIQVYTKSEVGRGLSYTYAKGAVPDGISAYFKAEVPTNDVPHTYVQGEVPDGIQVYTRAEVGPAVYTNNLGQLDGGIQVYTKSEVGRGLSYTYAKGAVPDGVSAYFKAEVPTNDVPHTTIPNVPTQPTTPSAPQPAQPVQPTTPAQPEPNQTVTTGVDGDHAPVMIKAHEQPQTESLIAEDSDAEPQATTGLGRKASVDGQFVSGHAGIGQSKPSEIQNAMPQLNEGSEKPVSILGYALLAIGGLTRWLTFKGKRQN